MTDPFREQLQQALASAYELGRELTGGGMSRVFVARERALDRTVVVKVLPPELAAGVNRDRFRREIQLAAGLHHPHIVPLLNAGEVPRGEAGAGPSWELLYYTMPYIEGESLRAALERRGALPVREVVRVLHDVVDALAYAHARGIVHRDIKPGNILVSGRHALVTDFGVAKALSAALPAAGMTTSGMAIGTPAYMAPEQLAGDPAADHRVDIYATGLLAYELLTGASPFREASPQATMAAQLTRVPAPLSACCPEVPAPLSAVIMRCLAKLPEERPQSAQVLLDELEEATGATSGETAARGAPPRLQDATATSPDRQRGGGARARWTTRGVAAGAIAASLLLAAVAGGLVVRDRRLDARLDSLSRGGASRAERALAAGGVDAGTGGSAAAGGARIAGGDAGAGTGATSVGAEGAPPGGQDAGAASRARQGSALTRADSLAIAEAVRREIERQSSASTGVPSGVPSGVRSGARGVAGAPPAPEVAAVPGVGEVARLRVEQAYIDSVTRSLERLRRIRGWGVPLDIDSLVGAQMRDGDAARRALAPAGRRVVLVDEVRDGIGRPEARAAAAAATAALRGALVEEGDYVVPGATQTRAVMRRDLTPVAAGRSAGAGAVITGVLVPHEQGRGDLVVLQLVVHDVARGRPLGTVASDPVPIGEAASAAPSAAARAGDLLDEAAWPAVRIVTPPAPPPAPRP